ncbi:MAG: hypothetical protein DI535_03495 [Citrobacter freundii]|nr:MAG: hypothetical protein DI535_03495 [Citrobacter freundii]
MKISFLLLFFFCCQSLFPQVIPIEVSTRITTSIQLHRSIKHVDIGSVDIIVQPVQAADSILLLKAATEQFTPTNLTVVTSDGSLHVFKISFSDNPSQWSYSLPLIDFMHPRQIADKLLSSDRWLYGVKDRSGDIRTKLAGIYVHEDLLFFVINITNEGALPFQIDGIRLYLKDRTRAKRVAIQETIVPISLIAGDTSQLRPVSSQALVFTISRQTLPPNQVLIIEMQERNGGRHISMRVLPHRVLQAKQYK